MDGMSTFDTESLKPVDSVEDLQAPLKGQEEKGPEGKKSSLIGKIFQPLRDLGAELKAATKFDTFEAHLRDTSPSSHLMYAPHNMMSDLDTEFRPEQLDTMRMRRGTPHLVSTHDEEDEQETFGFGHDPYTASELQNDYSVPPLESELLDNPAESSETGSKGRVEGAKNLFGDFITNGDVRNITGTPLVGAAYAPIVLRDGTTKAHSFVALALKTKLAVSNTQIPTSPATTNGAKVQQFMKKAPEAAIHFAAEAASAVVTTPLILAANGLAKLGGSFDEVKNAYADSLQNFCGNKPTIPGRIAAGMMTGCAFIKWAFANAAALTAAGLSMILNIAIGLVDKIASGAVALTVNAVAGAIKFVANNKKAVGGLALAGGVATGLVFAAKAILSAVGAGAVAAGSVFGAKAVGALIGLVLVFRALRFVYEHVLPSPAANRAKERFFHKVGELEEKVDLNGAVAGLTATVHNQELTLSGDTSTERLNPNAAKIVKADSIITKFYGSEESRKYLAAKADSTHYRVISRGFGHYARAAGRDLMRTFSSWSKGRDDVTITRRALAFKTDAELEKEVAAYKVDKKVSVEEQPLVKRALMASLLAGRAVARHEYVTTVANAEEKQKLGEALKMDELEKARATTYLLSGSDTEILKAVYDYTNIQAPKKAPEAKEEGAEAEDLPDTPEAQVAALPAMFSVTITDAVEGVKISTIENRVAIEATVAEYRKLAPAMAKALNENKSQFAQFLKTEKGAHFGAASEVVGVAVNGVEVPKATKTQKFDEAAFNKMFDFQDATEIDAAEDKIEKILANAEAVKLMEAYKEFSKLSMLAKRAYNPKTPKKAKPAAPKLSDMQVGDYGSVGTNAQIIAGRAQAIDLKIEGELETLINSKSLDDVDTFISTLTAAKRQDDERNDNQRTEFVAAYRTAFQALQSAPDAVAPEEEEEFADELMLDAATTQHEATLDLPPAPEYDARVLTMVATINGTKDAEMLALAQSLHDNRNAQFVEADKIQVYLSREVLTALTTKEIEACNAFLKAVLDQQPADMAERAANQEAENTKASGEGRQPVQAALVTTRQKAAISENKQTLLDAAEAELMEA